MPELRRARSIEQEGRRHGRDSYSLGELAVGVAQQQERRRRTGEVLLDRSVFGIHADRGNGEAAVPELSLELGIERQGFLAGVAPGRPEVEQHDAPTEVG